MPGRDLADGQAKDNDEARIGLREYHLLRRRPISLVVSRQTAEQYEFRFRERTGRPSTATFRW